MTWRLPRRNVRLSLTLWYVAAMGVILTVYVAVVFVIVARNLSISLDDRLRDDFDWAAAMADVEPGGQLTWFDPEDASQTPSPWLTVWQDGRVIFRTGSARRNPLPDSAVARIADHGIASVPTSDDSLRVLKGPSTIFGQPLVLAVARSEAAMRGQQYEVLTLLLFGLPIALVAAGLGGFFLANRALAPIDRLAHRARTITAERLSDRLPVDNPRDEIGRLATVFNDTLQRLESSFLEMQRFTTDVSHELRTPLTAMKSVGEVSLRERGDEASSRAAIGSMLEEIDRLAAFIDRLLVLSRMTSGERATREPIDVAALAKEVAEQLAVLAEEKQQTLALEAHGHSRVVGDALMLRQAVANLLDNAIKYTPVGGEISLRVNATDTGTILDVSDNGPGIPEEAQARIFDRFERGHAPNSPQEGAGVGLGLSISRKAVEANGGTLTLVPHAHGSTFRIHLPRDGASA